jgi:hypothetical protein
MNIRIKKKIVKINNVNDIVKFCKPCSGIFCFNNINICKDQSVRNLLSKQYLKINDMTSDNIKYKNFYQNILKEIIQYSDINNVNLNNNMSTITKSFVKEYLLIDAIEYKSTFSSSTSSF